MIKTRYLLLVLTSLLLAACQVPSISERSKDNKLRDTLNSYESVIRWGILEKAYGFLSPELSEEAVIPDNLKNFRVTGYERINGPSPLSDDKAAQTVLIEYVLVDRQVLRSLIDKQIWQWAEEEKAWQRANPIPIFE